MIIQTNILLRSLTDWITSQEKDSDLKGRVRYYCKNMVLHFKCKSKIQKMWSFPNINLFNFFQTIRAFFPYTTIISKLQSFISSIMGITHKKKTTSMPKVEWGQCAAISPEIKDKTKKYLIFFQTKFKILWIDHSIKKMKSIIKIIFLWYF